MNKFVIKIIRFYKKHISIFFESKGIKCKYYPTCSNYAIQAFEKYHFWKASFYTIKRIARCNPFSKGGYDPLK